MIVIALNHFINTRIKKVALTLFYDYLYMHVLTQVSQARIRQIKPLLTASSRLGRSLAELFGLLAKLSVGLPVRQRRAAQQLTPAVTMPTPAARAIASHLAQLLSRGLVWHPPEYCPIPKLR